MGWQRDVYEGIRPLFFAADAESIHGWTVTGMRKVAEGSYGRALLSHLAADGPSGAWAARPTEQMGLRFRNPVGLAAGFDKDGVATPGLGRAGVRVRGGRNGDSGSAGRKRAATRLAPDR